VHPIVQNIQKGPSPWYAVTAGILAALLVTAGNLYVAHRQRKTTEEQFREQLGAAGDRLDRQLNADRKLRAKETKAAAIRLERQLGHDRRLRDLDHVRALLTPMILTAANWEQASALIAAATADEPQSSSLLEAKRDIRLQIRDILNNRASLGVIVGGEDDALHSFTGVANVLEGLTDAVDSWAAGDTSIEDLRTKMDETKKPYVEAVSKFLFAAYGLVGWEPPATA
jgi:hypothetical protein